MTSRLAIVLACLAMAIVSALDLVGDGRLGLLFSVGFVLIAVTTPLSTKPRPLFGPGILPTLLMIVSIGIFALLLPSAIQSEGLAATDGAAAHFIAGVIGHANALVIGQLLAVAVIWFRVTTTPNGKY